MDAVDMWLRRYPDSPVVLDVLGTLDPDEIRGQCVEVVPDTAEVFFFRVSVGALFGVRRANGARIAVKVHRLLRDECYLDDVQRLQARLAEAGFPAPRPLGRKGFCTLEEWRDDGEFRDGHDPNVRRAMARHLARFHEAATGTGIRPSRPFLRPDPGAVWPKPHNALFDFEATRAGAAWIDEIGAEAGPIARAEVGRTVVGHTDWSAKHFRFDDRLAPTVLYDWDSVQTEREPNLVGTAAASFTYTQELEQPVALWPSADETLAFIADYQAASGTAFTPDELRSAKAAAVWLHAYAARCVHAAGGTRTDLAGLAEVLL